jgi:HemX protein
MFSLMYLVKLRQLRHGVAVARIRLPALERLDRWSSIAVYVAWPMLTIGLGLGFLLHELSLTDPKVITSMVAWMILTVLAHFRYQPEHPGRRIAVLTVVAAAAMLVVLLGDGVFGTAHQAGPPTEAGS